MATDVWGICMARNEADIIATTVAHMLREVDHVLVADNLSTDDTAALAADAGAEVITDSDPAYRQSEKMTALAHRARAAGAIWVVPFDADELWISHHGRIGDVLTASPSDIVTAVLYDHVSAGSDFDKPPTQRMAWRRREPGRLPKVACRTDENLTIAMGNHAADYGRDVRTSGGLVVHHYPYRSPAQFVSKVRQGSAALALTRLPLHAGAHWRDYGRTLERGGEQALHDHYFQWFHVPDPMHDPSVVFDPVERR